MGWAKVLLVDNEPKYQRHLSTFLRMFDYKVFVAANGLDGLDKVQQERPDIIIMDPVLPVKDGISLFQEMKRDKNLNSIPVVMLVTSGEQTDVVRQPGVSGFVAKTSRLVDIEKRIRHIVEDKRSQKEKAVHHRSE
ncbi:MAG: response regulator [Candidatus Auribacterota bacterium]|jgi:two-component system alkaline phosphatase synthesis response regulator PhoP|uniref:Response regulator n=1 Tax=Candidatus Auribacter fodinae TaxID=2093366 RepID=A0A3A4R4V5_9BACT|nr:MAG: response regulator [Candidatus Auribacter fodinae]